MNNIKLEKNAEIGWFGYNSKELSHVKDIGEGEKWHLLKGIFLYM